MLAIAAASMANAGVCPLTEDPVFTPGTVQSCLSQMSSCGMYDFSGEFAFTIGLPAKSGVSGAVMLVPRGGGRTRRRPKPWSRSPGPPAKAT